MKEEVAIISSEFPPQPGGLGQQAASLAVWLHRSGKVVRVVTNSRGFEPLTEERTYDKALPFPVERARHYRLVVATYLQRLLLAYRQVDRSDPITVIASGKFSLWLAALLRFFYPRHRYLAVLHGSELTLGGFSRRLTRLSLRGLDRAVAVSHFTAGLARQLQPRLKLTVIPNGFDPERLDRYPGKKALRGEPALITVGKVSRRKGQHNVIRALPGILERFPGAHYHLVGLPAEQAAFEALAEELGVRDHVTFHGPLPDADLAPALRGADLFLMLSERQADGDVEGFGIAILEANYLGLPAIGADDSGIADAVRDGHSGRLVKSNDPRAVTSAVAEVLADYAGYRERAQSWAAGFTWEKIIQQYLEILEE